LGEKGQKLLLRHQYLTQNEAVSLAPPPPTRVNSKPDLFGEVQRNERKEKHHQENKEKMSIKLLRTDFVTALTSLPDTAWEEPSGDAAEALAKAIYRPFPGHRFHSGLTEIPTAPLDIAIEKAVHRFLARHTQAASHRPWSASWLSRVRILFKEAKTRIHSGEISMPPAFALSPSTRSGKNDDVDADVTDDGGAAAVASKTAAREHHQHQRKQGEIQQQQQQPKQDDGGDYVSASLLSQQGVTAAEALPCPREQGTCAGMTDFRDPDNDSKHTQGSVHHNPMNVPPSSSELMSYNISQPLPASLPKAYQSGQYKYATAAAGHDVTQHCDEDGIGGNE